MLTQTAIDYLAAMSAISYATVVEVPWWILVPLMLLVPLSAVVVIMVINRGQTRRQK